MCLGLQQQQRARLKIKSFYIRLSDVSNAHKHLPDSLTLYFLPRINGSPLDINGSNIRPDSPGFVTLHRVVSGTEAFYGSRERVRASQGVRFEVYLRDEKVLRGGFRRDIQGNEWIMECKCVLEREVVGVEVKAAEVYVETEDQAAILRERVEVAVHVRRNRKQYYCFQGLEEIPEEREVDDESACCCCEVREIGSDGIDCGVEESTDHEDKEGMEMEGVRWAVDVGIWVVSLGVGYLVARASSKSLRRIVP